MSEPPPTDASIADAPRELGRRATLLVIATAIVVLFAFLGYRATLTEHEVFAAEPAREMLAGGPLLLQPFAGALRVKKPPGQSWLIAASMGVFRTQNEFAARLPSAVAATLLALLLGGIGARLKSRRVGLIAALMTLTTYGVQVRARLAEADMALSLTIATSFAAVLWSIRRGDACVARVGQETFGSPHESEASVDPATGDARVAPTLLPATAFWASVVAGVFLKGPIPLGFALPPLTIAYFILRWRGDRAAAAAIARTVLHPVPLVAAVLVVVAWVTAAIGMYPDIIDAWRHEVVDRATGEMRRDSPLLYVGLLPEALLPWCPFTAIALVGGIEAWRSALRRPAVLVLSLWAGVGFVVISCVALKALHYTLPIVPPFILLAAFGFDATLSRFSDGTKGVAARAYRERGAIAAWFGVAALAWVASQLFFEPRRETVGVKPFALQVEQVVPADEPIYFVGVGEERTAFYLHRRLVQTKLAGADDLDAQLARLPLDAAAYVLCRVPNVAEIAARASVVELARSADFRGHGEDVERRALLCVVRAAATTRPLDR